MISVPLATFARLSLRARPIVIAAAPIVVIIVVTSNPKVESTHITTRILSAKFITECRNETTVISAFVLFIAFATSLQTRPVIHQPNKKIIMAEIRLGRKERNQFKAF